MIPRYFVILKIISLPLDENNFNETQRIELDRLLTNSTTDSINYRARNFSFSEIHKIYFRVLQTVPPNDKYTEEDNIIATFDNYALKDYGADLMTMDKFIERLKDIQRRSAEVCWVVWSGLKYDIAKINYEIIKEQKDVKILPTIRYKEFPVFDIMEWLYSWGLANSFFLTCETFGIKTNEQYLDKTFLSQMYSKKDDKELDKYLGDLGEYLTKLFLQMSKYFFK